LTSPSPADAGHASRKAIADREMLPFTSADAVAALAPADRTAADKQAEERRAG
jgi:hypothetical protein